MEYLHHLIYQAMKKIMIKEYIVASLNDTLKKNIKIGIERMEPPPPNKANKNPTIKKSRKIKSIKT